MAGSDKALVKSNNKSCILKTRHTSRGDERIYVEMDEKMSLGDLFKSLSMNNAVRDGSLS